MNYSDFCKLLYFERSKTAFKGITSQGELAVFLFRIVLQGETLSLLNNLGDDSYRKWYSGINNPSNTYWNAVVENWNEMQFCAKVNEAINEDCIRELAEKFNLPNDESINDTQFVYALAMQFFELAKGQGEAANVFLTYYGSFRVNSKFSRYLSREVEERGYIHFHGADDFPLSSMYICNDISKSKSIVTRRNSNNVLKNATLESLREWVSGNHCLLIGNSGIGKTLMLRHFFIEAVERYPSTGIMPLFVELMNYSSYDGSLLPMLLRSINQLDDSIKEADLIEALTTGNCTILMDGLDEIDHFDLKSFQNNLQAFFRSFPKSQVIITSRNSRSTASIRKCVSLQILPFSSDQQEKLIDILIDEDEAKRGIKEFLNDGYLKKDSVFATNPMLLSFLIRFSTRLDRYKDNKIGFYHDVYELLLRDHDDDKDGYSRVFHSVESPDDFTIAFREFCALTFLDGVHNFDREKFEKYFRRMESPRKIQNHHNLTYPNFLYDACASACIMYESELDLFYIDIGFQEILFAEYFDDAEETDWRKLAKKLEKMPASTENLAMLKMLNKRFPEEIKEYLIVPYLQSIFEKESSFFEFLRTGYRTIRYAVLFKNIIDEYEEKYPLTSQMVQRNSIVPYSLIVMFLVNSLDVEKDFSLVIETSDEHVIEYKTTPLIGEIVKDSDESYISITPKRFRYSGLPNEGAGELITNDEGNAVCFGQLCKVDFNTIDLDSAENQKLFAVFMQSYFGKIFNELRLYYQYLCG